MRRRIYLLNIGICLIDILMNETMAAGMDEHLSKDQLSRNLEDISVFFKKLKSDLKATIIGQEEAVKNTLVAIFAGGHVLLEGAPGLGKTLMIKTIASLLGCSFKRIQFTPDLMPSDVTGTKILVEENGKKNFVFNEGPIFAQVVLADEINRATPRTQSALLEAMAEGTVSILGDTMQLPSPFFVLATQNPLELEGTFPLPEAQLDRFMFKVNLPSPTSEELKMILTQKSANQRSCEKFASSSFASEDIQTIKKFKGMLDQVLVSPTLVDIIVRYIESLTPNTKYAPKVVNTYLRFGPGPRGAQAILASAKVYAVIDGRVNLSLEDIKKVLLPALRHRISLNYTAESARVNADDILNEIMKAK